MAAFYIALVIGVLVSVAYVTLALEEFARARRWGTAPGDDGPEVFERQGRGFSWVAGGGVVVSTSLLVLVSLDGSFWYLLPLLGIGSAVAVAVAFLVDRGEGGQHAADQSASKPEVAA